MTPKEKVLELVEKFKFETKQSEIINDIILGDVSIIFQHHKAKQCALIAVDEILEILWHTHKNADEYKYYQEVKKEIEKL